MSLFRIILLSFMALGFLFIAPHAAQASDNWSLYSSKTGLFSVLVPGNPDENFEEFRVGNDMTIYNTESVAFIDQRPYRDTIKNYVVKVDQTFGPGINGKNRVEIVEREMKIYKDLYREDNPKIVTRTIKDWTDRTYGEIALTYNNLDDEPQGVRVKIVVTNSSKFHQIFSGPAKDIQSEVTEKFFKSLDINSGVVRKAGNINNDWRKVESPFSLFAVKVPPITAPYFTHDPSVTEEDLTEKIGMVFTDPVWGHSLFYNVTGYEFDEEMSFDLAEAELLEKHLTRHGRSMVGISLTKDFIDETPYIETNYAIKPPNGYPYVNHVRLRGMFLGNYMIVQEVVGPQHLVLSKFTKNFFDLIEFTPKKASQKAKQKAAKTTVKPLLNGAGTAE